MGSGENQRMPSTVPSPPGGGLAGHPIQAYPPRSPLAAPPRDSGPTPSEAGPGTPPWHFIWSLSI